MTSPIFEFKVDVIDSPDFTVVSFEGSEKLSHLYEYVIELKASTTAITSPTFLEDMLDANPEFKITYGSEVHPTYGMLSDFTENYTAENHTYFTAKIVPRLWQLTLNRDSRVYNDPSEDTVLEILTSMLNRYQLDYLTGDITGDLLSRDYRCQFNETDFNFLSRLLENEGIYYYFDHSNGTDQIVFSNGFADTDGFAFAAVPANPAGSMLTFDANPPANTVYESITGWSCQKVRLPSNVTMESYSSETPSTNPSGGQSISTNLYGEQYIYGDNIDDDDEGEYLAQIRAEEFTVNSTMYYGESGVCGLRSGYCFKMSNHPNDNYNKVTNYLITEVTHSGTFLDSTADSESSSGQSRFARKETRHESSKPQYENSFVAIDEAVQFRPARVTPKPSFHGTLSAEIYSETHSDYAELDRQGHYRVLLPFRKNTSSDDHVRVSHWIRMAQPYAGDNEGMFFPLKWGTEVLLTFINGDPDRPIISAALPNAVELPLLNDLNSTEAIIQTKGGNRITLKDADNDESARLVLQSTTGNTSLRLGGLDNDGTDDVGGIQDVSGETDGIQLRTDNNNIVIAASNNEISSTGGNNKITALQGNAILTGGTTSIQTALDDFESEVGAKCGIYPAGHANAGQPKVDADKTAEETIATTEYALARNTMFSEGATRIVSGKDCKISARDDAMNIKMEAGGMEINAPGKDITMNCLNYNIEATAPATFKWFQEHKHVTGNSTSTYIGFKQSACISGNADVFLGGKVSAFIGGSASFNLAAKFDLSVVNDFKIFLGFKQTFQASAEFTLAYAPKFEIKSAPDLKKKLLELKKKDVEIDAAEVKLANRKVTMNDINIDLLNAQFSIDKSTLKMSG